VQILAGLCLLLFVASVTVSGARLLWVSRKTRRAPERLLGAGSLLIGTVAQPLSVASGFGGNAGDVDAPLWVVSEALTQLGIVCLYAFTQQVFRPRVAWARRGIVAVAVVLPLCLAGAAHGLATATPETISVAATGGWLLVCHFVYAGAFVWSAVEGFQHYRSARRRVAIGLADPVVTNRFLLFAIYGLASTGISLANAAAVVLERNISTSLVVMLPAAVLAPVAAGAMFLAILSPAWYAERVRAHVGAAPL